MIQIDPHEWEPTRVRYMQPARHILAKIPLDPAYLEPIGWSVDKSTGRSIRVRLLHF